MKFYLQKFFKSFILLYFCAIQLSTSTRLTLDPDETKSFSELVSSHGYRLQEYHVLTPDGYILAIHRVVPRNFSPAIYNLYRKPVLAWHGVLCDSAFFFFNSPFTKLKNFCGDNFGFCMLQSGRYDLWLGNARGNRYSRAHLRYNDQEKEFWEFSWDDIALNDIPATIDLIQQVSQFFLHTKILTGYIF